MYVADILTEASEITGLQAGAMLYRWLSQCIAILSKKGNWDSMQLYMDISVQPNGLVILPREVETPIKININRQPAFSRSRLYEFALNGPGSGPLTDWQWMDQNTVPVLAELPATGTALVITADVADAGKKIRLYGLDKDGNELEDIITLAEGDQTTTNEYAVMRRVRKDMTDKRVQISRTNGDAVADYYSNEIEPKYRKIKLSKSATSVRMWFRRTTNKVTTEDDFIPLDSETAILTMLRAYSLMRKSGVSTESEGYENKAVQYLKEDQDSRNSSQILAAEDEMPPAFNLNLNNRDSVIAADCIDDAAEIFGPIGVQKLLDKMTVATETLKNKNPAWDATDGYVDLKVGAGGLTTLPRYIKAPIAVNWGGKPMIPRNKWFEFHLNGSGSDCGSSTHWDNLGEVVTVEDPSRPFRLVAINDLEVDNGTTVRVFGVGSNGKVMRTANPDLDSSEKYIDGLILTANASNVLPNGESPWFRRITRIIRDKTSGYQQLLAYNDCDSDPIMIGYYYPEETEPRYWRIKVPYSGGYCNTSAGQNPCYPWIRVRYRRRDLRVRELTDNLHLRSNLAIVNMMRAMKLQATDLANGRNYELQAVEYLKEDQSANNPTDTFSFQIDRSTAGADSRQGQY